MTSELVSKWPQNGRRTRVRNADEERWAARKGKSGGLWESDFRESWSAVRKQRKAERRTQRQGLSLVSIHTPADPRCRPRRHRCSSYTPSPPLQGQPVTLHVLGCC